MARPKVILDCDPGHDDAVAILLAARHLDLLGITTVGGNQSLERVTANALRVVELANLTAIPVAKGMATPLVNQARHAASIHGESGLDGHVLPEPVTTLDPSGAVEFIIDTVMTVEGVTLIPTGPLTNIATALRLEPRLRDRVAGISLMGGSLTGGNATPAAEFNIFVDPEAAHIVFTSGIPLKMCGLNLTRQASVGRDDIARIGALGNRTGTAIADLLAFYRDSAERAYGATSVPLHDPCAVAALIDPTLIDFEPMHIAIELRGEHTYGMTVCDNRFLNGRGGGPPPNAEVGIRIDRARFLDLVCGTLATYP